MIEPLKIVAHNGQPLVRQRLIQPAVYLDTWAIIDLSEDDVLGSRFRDALLKAGGTLVLSPLTFVDFAGMDDARHAARAGEFIGSIAPHLFFSHFDPFTVRTREVAVMVGQTKESPAGDTDLLMKFAEAANHASMHQCLTAWFGAMYRARAQLRADRDGMAAALFAGIDALRKRIDEEPDVAKELRTPLKDADRPRSTHALLRVLVSQMQADRSLPRKPNHAIDLLQCVVPAAYCSYVLVDAQWYARLTQAKAQMDAEGMTARVATPYTKKSDGLEAFLTALEAEWPALT